MKRLKFPPEVAAKLAKLRGQEYVDGFLEEWAALSRSDQIRYLNRIKYPMDRLSELEQDAAPEEEAPAEEAPPPAKEEAPPAPAE